MANFVIVFLSDSLCCCFERLLSIPQLSLSFFRSFDDETMKPIPDKQILNANMLVEFRVGNLYELLVNRNLIS